jgi:hypothetical protein
MAYWFGYCLLSQIIVYKYLHPGMFSPSVVRSTEEIIVYIFLDIVHGLIIPMQMEIPWRTKVPQQASEFYVRKPASLEPRRDDLQLQYASHSRTLEIANKTKKLKRKQNIPIRKSINQSIVQSRKRKTQNKREEKLNLLRQMTTCEYNNCGFKISELEREQKALKEILKKSRPLSSTSTAKSMDERKNQNERQETVMKNHQVLAMVEVHKQENGMPPVE